MIDVPLLIRQLNQRHMTGCAVLLNVIMWWVKSARQPSGLYWTACRFVVQLCKLKTKHVRFLSRLFTWVDCSAGDTRSSEKGQMRERRLEKSRELYIVSQTVSCQYIDSLLFWRSPLVRLLSAVSPVWPEHTAWTSWVVLTLSLKLYWALTQILRTWEPRSYE